WRLREVDPALAVALGALGTVGVGLPRSQRQRPGAAAAVRARRTRPHRTAPERRAARALGVGLQRPPPVAPRPRDARRCDAGTVRAGARPRRGRPQPVLW